MDTPVAEWTSEEFKQAVETKRFLIRHDTEELAKLIAEFQAACPHPTNDLRDNRSGRDRVCTRCGLVEYGYTFQRLRNYGDIAALWEDAFRKCIIR